uniref:Uncharacterized protein n=1 Tax=Molossus molossus TaxID=27622 RepID=A0A7J8C922_MOLMO|nr:hypothetical protein HJG59_009990 [Molossus molossus]
MQMCDYCDHCWGEKSQVLRQPRSQRSAQRFPSERVALAVPRPGRMTWDSSTVKGPCSHLSREDLPSTVVQSVGGLRLSVRAESESPAQGHHAWRSLLSDRARLRTSACSTCPRASQDSQAAVSPSCWACFLPPPLTGPVP